MPEAARYHVAGIGNAIVDVISREEEAFIDKMSLTKGAMTLVDGARSREIYDQMGKAVEESGGSAGNTMAGIASLGGKAAFIGKVDSDQLGDIFRHDIRADGVDFDTPSTVDGVGTGCCLVVVTPDAQRTMNTYLGVAVELSPEDVDPDVIAGSAVTYMEGYLWDPPKAKQAFLKAAEIAHGAGRKVSLSLSDPFCVDRHKQEFLDLVDNQVDILFANEDEIKALYDTDTFDAAVAAVRGRCEIAALTRSDKGSMVVTTDEIVEIAASPVADVVDTTGAGDQYAAGMLYGLTHGLPLSECLRIASIAAAEVISHLGARPLEPLFKLLQK